MLGLAGISIKWVNHGDHRPVIKSIGLGITGQVSMGMSAEKSQGERIALEHCE